MYVVRTHTHTYTERSNVEWNLKTKEMPKKRNKIKAMVRMELKNDECKRTRMKIKYIRMKKYRRESVQKCIQNLKCSRRRWQWRRRLWATNIERSECRKSVRARENCIYIHFWVEWANALVRRVLMHRIHTHTQTHIQFSTCECK